LLAMELCVVLPSSLKITVQAIHVFYKLFLLHAEMLLALTQKA
jgi:hypothetical protein